MRLPKLLITVTLCLLLSVVAFAHPGGTDSSGGHYNRSTGEYHFHHGHSAHQHTDKDGDGILDCPFDFDDKTGSSSGSSSSSNDSTKPTTKSKAPTTIPTTPPVRSQFYQGETTSSEESDTTFEKIWDLIVYFGVLFFQIVGIMLVFLCILKVVDDIIVFIKIKSRK